MKAALLTTVVGLFLALPALAIPQAQVVDDFSSGTADGRPAGWEVLGFGAEASITHQAADPGTMKVTYRFTQPQGVIYLLGRGRVRTTPWNIELTLRGDGGGQVVGVLLREAATGKLYDLRAEQPLKETGWATRAIEPKLPGGDQKLETLEDGGGIRIDGLTLRKGPGAPDQGVLDISEIVAQCDVQPPQAVMVDITTARHDGIFLVGEQPKPELLLSYLSTERATFEVSYTVTDGDNREVGRATERAAVSSAALTRLPVRFTPRGNAGFYTVRATAKLGQVQRSATTRFCVIPAVPEGPGRHIGVDVTAHREPAEEWLDVAIFRALKRAGAGAARVELRWAEIEPTQGWRKWEALDHLVRVSRLTGLPLALAAAEPPGWVLRNGMQAVGTGFAGFLREAASRAGDTVVAWQLWREPNTRRFWPPEPQPFAYRALLEAAAPLVRPSGRTVTVATGGLRGFEPGYVGTLLVTEPAPLDQLALALPASRHAFPFIPLDQRPSEIALKQLRAYREWIAASGRKYVPATLVEAGVRTSPVEASKLGQALEMARCAALARAYGGNLYWNKAYDGSDESDRFGLLRRDLQPKPALATLAANAALLHGATFLGTPKSAGRPTFILSGPQGFAAVTWGSGSLSVPDEAKAHDVWGAEQNTSWLSLSEAPTYLRGKGVAALLR